MREIKFRAWNGKMMIPEHEGYRFKILGNGSVWEKNNYGDEQLAPELVLMQFTGCLDKNDKKIYEGDIYQQLGSTAIGIVEWSSYRAGFLVSCKWQKIRNGKIVRRADSFETPLHNDGNIIGNIYENPELLAA